MVELYVIRICFKGSLLRRKSKRKGKKDRESTMGLQRVVLVTVALGSSPANLMMESWYAHPHLQH